MPSNDRARAVDTMLRNFPHILETLWIKKHAEIRTEGWGYLSGGQRILVEAAQNIWNGNIVKVDLEGVIYNLDDRNFDAFMDAILIARGRKPESREPSRAWYSRLALAKKTQSDLNQNEHAVLISCAASSEGNGHDFGIVEEITGGEGGYWYGDFKPAGLTVAQVKGYLSQLQAKGYISIHEPEKVNGEYWVTQFTLTDRGREVFRLDE